MLLTAAVLAAAMGSSAPVAASPAAADTVPKKVECTPVWVEADEPTGTCDVDALSEAVLSHSGLCRSTKPETADVTITILECRKPAPSLVPTAAWVQHEARVDVRTRERHATFWASDRHSWAGVGRDLARRTLLWLHSGLEESGPIADASSGLADSSRSARRAAVSSSA
jgi:hypothetical protein